VINEALANRHFRGQNPVGAFLQRGVPLEIVGVVKDVRTIGLAVSPKPMLFELATEWPSSAPVTYVVRLAPTAEDAVNWHAIVQRVDPAAVIVSSGSLWERLERSVRNRFFAAFVASVFALTTLLVTA